MSLEAQTFKIEPFDVTDDTALVLLRTPANYVDDAAYEMIQKAIREKAGRDIRLLIAPEGYGLENATEEVMRAAGWVRR